MGSYKSIILYFHNSFSIITPSINKTDTYDIHWHRSLANQNFICNYWEHFFQWQKANKLELVFNSINSIYSLILHKMLRYVGSTYVSHIFELPIEFVENIFLDFQSLQKYL